MSSSVHAKCRTIDRSSIEEAAKELGIKLQEFPNGAIGFQNTQFKFDEKGNVDVKYYKDHVDECRKTKQLSQLGTYFSSIKRLNKAGLSCTKSLKDVVLAVKSNQKLKLEFEEQEQEQVTVNA